MSAAATDQGSHRKPNSCET